MKHVGPVHQLVPVDMWTEHACGDEVGTRCTAHPDLVSCKACKRVMAHDDTMRRSVSAWLKLVNPRLYAGVL